MASSPPPPIKSQSIWRPCNRKHSAPDSCAAWFIFCQVLSNVRCPLLKHKYCPLKSADPLWHTLYLKGSFLSLLVHGKPQKDTKLTFVVRLDKKRWSIFSAMQISRKQHINKRLDYCLKVHIWSDPVFVHRKSFLLGWFLLGAIHISVLGNVWRKPHRGSLLIFWNNSFS